MSAPDPTSEERSPSRVVLAHPEPLLCEGLTAHLESDGAIEVVAQLTEPSGLVASVAEHDAHAALVSVSGDEFRKQAEALVMDRPDVGVIALSAAAGLDGASEVLAQGVHAIVPTTAPPARLRSAVAAVIDGWMVMPRDGYRDVLTRVATARSEFLRLDAEEREMMAMVARGTTIIEIAQSAHVSARTVKRRLAALFEQLGCDSRAEAVQRYGEAVMDGAPEHG